MPQTFYMNWFLMSLIFLIIFSFFLIKFFFLK